MNRFRTSFPQNLTYRLALLLGLISLVLLLVPIGPAQAQNYSFSIPELRMQVFVNPDASARIVYDITFENSAFADAIDIVDIGTPHSDYDIGNMSGNVDGVPVTDIRTSTYIDTGVEIHLEDQAIPPGETGAFHFEFTMPDMVYEDTTQDDYASLQITPTWFDDSLVEGTSDIWVVMHMLPGIEPDEVLFQDVPFTNKAVFEDHVVAGWRWPDSRATHQYLVGASFPQRGMERVVEQSLLDLTRKWLQDNPSIRLFLGIIAAGLFTFAYFRFSGGTGFSVFVILGGVGFFIWAGSVLASIWLLPLTLGMVGLVEWRLAERKDKYLPAIAQVEGGGIKRGLTAPEAAVLLELPLNKVLLLILFGLLEKGVIRLENDDPLAVSVKDPYIDKQETSDARRAARREVAQEAGIVLRGYEHVVLDILQENPDKPVQKMDFSKPIEALLQSVVDRMEGFDLSDTKDYYRKIIDRAMTKAQQIGEVPEFEDFMDRNMPWILMGEDYGPVFRRRGYEYRPVWVRPYIGGGHRRGGEGLPSFGGGDSGGGPSAPGGKTSFGDVAAAFAGWTENQAGSLADTISPSAMQLPDAGGFVNLSGADRVTGDIFKALAEGAASGGSGGSSGGCACACAGCACACACAGGGR